MLVSTTLDGHVALLRLDDVGHRNAMSPQMSLDLEQAVGDALSAGARAIVLGAVPPVFCAGGSLDSLIERSSPLEVLYRGFEALWNAPVPTVAAVGTPCIGAGVNVPLCCDVIVASPSARFDPRFLDVGIHPGGGHLWRLERRIGAQGAAALVLLGESLDGEEAARCGLAWRCVPDDEVEAVALALAHKAAKRDPVLVARTKQSLRTSMTLATAEEAGRLEFEAQQWSMDRPEFAATVRRIKEAVEAKKKS